MKNLLIYLSIIVLAISCKDDDPVSGDVTADFKASMTLIEEGSSIDFTDLSDGVPSSWEWEFEGGSPATSTEKNPSVNYTDYGVYKVKLTVSNKSKSDEKIKSGYITVMPSGLVSYYPLDGNSDDISSNANDGDIDGPKFDEDRKGNPKSALKFNGDGYFDISEAVTDLKTKEKGTIMFWYKPSSATPAETMNIFSASALNNKFSTMYLSQFTGGEVRLTHWKDDKTKMYGGSFSNFVFTSTDWHHLAIVQDGLEVKMYVDGISKDFSYGSSPSDKGAWFNDIDGFDVFYFGVQYSQMNGFQRYLTGSVDEIQIYRTALSKDEITFAMDF